MNKKHKFYFDDNDNVIVTVEEGVEINYGRLRLITTESDRMIVTDLCNYGDIVELIRDESLGMEFFDGRMNLNLAIEVGDDGLPGSFRFYPVNNDDIDPLCRMFTETTGKVVKVVTQSRILAVYDGDEVQPRKSLNDFYYEVTQEQLEETTW